MTDSSTDDAREGEGADKKPVTPRRLSLPGQSELSRMTGAQRALLFVVSLDEGVATRVLSHLSDEEVKLLRQTSESHVNATPRALAAVHRDFLARVREGAPRVLMGSNAYLRRLAGNALGEGRAAEVWSEVSAPKGGIAELARLEPSVVAELLVQEQPQTTAVVLSQLPSAHAAKVVERLPPEQQGEVLLRLTRLESIPEPVLRDIEHAFLGHLRDLSAVSRHDIPGRQSAADIMKRLPDELGREVLEIIREQSPELAEGIERALFTFEDLARIDSRGLQQLLKEVPTDQLVLALKTASELMREKIFGNVSSRAADMLREELSLLGAVRVSDVEQAQYSIIQTALHLEREGRIQIAREGTGDYV